jgi:hypothetical protein
MNERNIKELRLTFPHGISLKIADEIARRAQGAPDVGAHISFGGLEVLRMPLTKEDEEQFGIEFSKEVAHYEFGHKDKA